VCYVMYVTYVCTYASNVYGCADSIHAFYIRIFWLEYVNKKCPVRPQGKAKRLHSLIDVCPISTYSELLQNREIRNRH
jgi:hypothetical protein